MTRLKRAETEPETRIGHCCGCRSPNDLLLYKVQGISRYRCDECFERETGHRHHLSPPKERSRIVLP